MILEIELFADYAAMILIVAVYCHILSHLFTRSESNMHESVIKWPFAIYDSPIMPTIIRTNHSL